MQESRLSNELKAIQRQKELCLAYNVDFCASAFNSIIGVAISTFDNPVNPINGLRHPIETKECANWYIWAGEYSDAEDFFTPIHVQHLLEICPEALAYLGLPPGWRFLFDNNGYQDVWHDESLINT